MKITQEEYGFLAICALRYCHGRETYMPTLIQEIVEKHFDDMSENTMQILENDADGMLEWDYGDPTIDKPGWIRFNDRIRAYNAQKRITKRIKE